MLIALKELSKSAQIVLYNISLLKLNPKI